NDEFAKWGRENQKNFFYYCIHFYREIILLQAGAGTLNRLTDVEIKMAEGLSKVLSIDKTSAIVGLIDKGIYFIERNANAKIMIAYLSSQIMRVVHEQNMQQYEKPFFSEWNV
ncbi:MAG: hypothetical protein H7Y00_15445, partial [Fimbriimonadaceae bacterium]|nr:hypothetical protein [Chitinophagales bacterium]